MILEPDGKDGPLPGEPNGDPGTAPGSSVLGTCKTPGTLEVGETKMRRLNRVQYDNSLRDLGLISADTRLAVETFAADSVIAGARRGFSIGGPVDHALAEDLVNAATSVAATATQNLSALVGCAPADAGEEDACARSFIASFGRRAFRRPLTGSEVDELFELFSTARGTYDFATGIEVVLASMLAAPEFIYLIENEPEGAAPGDVVAIDAFGLASRLSYFLWDSTPDEQLLTAAESGALSSEQGLELEIRRMLDDPRARGAVDRFIHEWSFIHELADARKDAALFDWFTAELAADLEASFVGSLENAFWEGDPTLSNFLGSETMLVNDRIASAYDIATVTGSEMVSVRLDPAQRQGLLTHPAFLALAAKPARGDPIHRGIFVREQLLCYTLQPPPLEDENGNAIDFNVPPPAPGVSNRERFRQHTASALCSSCHTLIDPIGFGFENYDAAGRFRLVDENGNAIDASGEVKKGGDLTGTFDGALELVERAIQSEMVAECITLQWFRFALGRQETPLDACSNTDTAQRFIGSGKNLKELVVALAMSDAFRYRKVSAP